MTRTGRIAAGLVLIVGAILLARNAWHADSDPQHAWGSATVLVLTWGAALTALLFGSLVADRGTRGREAGFVVPVVGVALMLPLTLHMPIVVGLYGATAFDGWTFFSLIFVGVAHVVFALLAGIRASQIARGKIPLRAGTIYQVTVIASAIPGIVVVVPVVLVALTGLPIWPLLRWMERWPDRGPEPGCDELPVAFALPARTTR